MPFMPSVGPHYFKNKVNDHIFMKDSNKSKYKVLMLTIYTN